MIGVVILVAALVVSVGAAYALKWKNGRFAAVDDTAELLTAEQIGSPLGERATMVQFSSAFCSPCRATRVLLTDIANKIDGVVTVEIDAEDNLELVRELDIMRTPTVLVLDSRGAVSTRASGMPRRDQVLTALGRAIPARH